MKLLRGGRRRKIESLAPHGADVVLSVCSNHAAARTLTSGSGPGGRYDMSERGTEIVPVRLDDGTEMLVEVHIAGGREKVADFGQLSMTNLMRSITSLSSSVIKAIEAVGPRKTTVEFGIEASLESGKLLALLCAGESKANLKVTLEWEQPSKPQL